MKRAKCQMDSFNGYLCPLVGALTASLVLFSNDSAQACGTTSSGTNVITGAETGTCFLNGTAGINVTLSGSIITNMDAIKSEYDPVIVNGVLVPSIETLGSVVIDGTVTVTGASSSGKSVLRYASGSAWGDTAGGITINGIATSASRGLYINDYTLNGDITVGSSGVLSAYNPTIWLLDGTSVMGDIVNRGILEATGNNAIYLQSPASVYGIKNYGTLFAQGYAITVANGASTRDGIVNYEGGSIIGGISAASADMNNGGFFFNKANSSRIDPGNIGTPTISLLRDYMQASSGSFGIAVNGSSTRGTDYSALNVRNASVSGALYVAVGANFSATNGTRINDVINGTGTVTMNALKVTDNSSRYWFKAVQQGTNDLDLIAYLGPSPYATVQTLKYKVEQSLVNSHVAGITSNLDHDTNQFGPNNISLSFVGRHSVLSDTANEGAGALVAAYKVTPNMRLGAFVDYAPIRNEPTGIKHGNTEPTIGGFAVYEQNNDQTGFSARVVGAYNHGSITVTRDAALDDTEAGSGKAAMKSFALSAETSYGILIAPTMVAAPYLGIRYTDVTRKGYTEGATDHVIAPLTYNDYGQRLTTALGGVRFFGKLGDKVNAFVGIGAEYDVNRKMAAYSGTSSIIDLETFMVATSSSTNRVRASVSAGLGYQIAANQSLSAQVGVRQQAYFTNLSITSMVKYSMGF